MASHILRKIIYETGASRFYDTMKGPQDNIQVDLVFRRIPQRYTDSQSRISYKPRFVSHFPHLLMVSSLPSLLLSGSFVGLLTYANVSRNSTLMYDIMFRDHWCKLVYDETTIHPFVILQAARGIKGRYLCELYRFS